jgi:hypothetical protein
MIPEQFLTMWLGANAIALALLMVAFWRAPLARWAFIAIFLWASVVNTITALNSPWEYTAYAVLTPFTGYQHFIEGFFSQHVAAFVLPIAAGQLAIAILLGMSERWRHWGERGAMAFLLAITPLGIGSGFPFPLIAVASLVVMEKGLFVAEHFPRPVTRRAPMGAAPQMAFARPRGDGRWHLPSLHWHARH